MGTFMHPQNILSKHKANLLIADTFLKVWMTNEKNMSTRKVLIELNIAQTLIMKSFWFLIKLAPPIPSTTSS